MTLQQSTVHLPRQITELSTQRFLSIQLFERLCLPQLTVLISAKVVGKSSFICFFEMLSWMLRSQKLQKFVLCQGGGR